jgi:hypothetical protein
MDKKKISIEDLAWEWYQSGMKIRWEVKTTPREEFHQHENYEDYMKAVKQYLEKHGHIPEFKTEKRTNLMSRREYPVIKVPASGNPNWGDGARTMCFVYSKNNGNFILEGYRGEVEEYLKKNHTHYFCYFSMWHFGHSRGYWRFWKDKSVTIFTPSKIAKEWKYRVIKYKPSDGYGYGVSTKKEDTVLKFKRLPKHWIPEFDEL